MAYYMFLEQGGGCDYTIGCGLLFAKIDGATTMEEAKAKLRAAYDSPGYYDPNSEMHLAKMSVVEVGSIEVLDTGRIHRDFQAAKVEKDLRSQEAKDRAQYEALKQKFGG